MKRKLDTSNNYVPPIKKRKMEISIFLEKIKYQEYKLNQILDKINKIDTRINNIDTRVKDIETFIEENKQPPKFKTSPSYFY